MPSYASLHPGAVAAARSIQASLGGSSAAGPAPEGAKPNHDGGGDDAFEALKARNRADEGRQRREFLAKMAEDTDPRVMDELRDRRDRRREEDLDEDDEDEDEGEERATRYSDDDADDDERPLKGKLKKAHNFARALGLSKRALAAMTEDEILAFAHKQSRREARLNQRAATANKARGQSSPSTASAGAAPQQGDEIAMPSKEFLKSAVKKVVDARGWGEDDATALESLGESIVQAVQHALEPRLRSAMRDQEARDEATLGEERARLVERYRELSDDEVFEEVSEVARELLDSGKARTLAHALRKAAVMELDDDEDEYLERRVRSEIETRSATHRRNSRPMVARQIREAPPLTEPERMESAQRAVFNKLLDDDPRGARRVWQKRTQKRARR